MRIDDAANELRALVRAWDGVASTLPRTDGQAVPLGVIGRRAVILVDNPALLVELGRDPEKLLRQLRELMTDELGDGFRLGGINLQAADPASISVALVIQRLIGAEGESPGP